MRPFTRFCASFAFLVCFALSACGKTEAEKTQEKVDDMNGKIAELNVISEEMNGMGLSLLYPEISRSTIRQMNDEDLAKAKRKLDRYIDLGTAVVNSSGDKNVEFADRGRLLGLVQGAQENLIVLKTEMDARAASKSEGKTGKPQSGTRVETEPVSVSDLSAEERAELLQAGRGLNEIYQKHPEFDFFDFDAKRDGPVLKRLGKEKLLEVRADGAEALRFFDTVIRVYGKSAPEAQLQETLEKRRSKTQKLVAHVDRLLKPKAKKKSPGAA